MKQFLLLSILFILSISFVSYKATHALFSDTAQSQNNTFSAAQTFHVVISEVQITGGTGEDNNNDFIELYNPTSSSISLNGMRLVKRTASSSSDDTVFTFNSNHMILAHGFFLWGHKSGGATPNNFADIIFADVSSAETIAGNNSIALIIVATSEIIDALSWNPAASSLKEGTEFDPDPEANESIERKALATSDATSMTSGADVSKGNGYDTDDNSNDFILREVSDPQNSSSVTEMP